MQHADLGVPFDPSSLFPSVFVAVGSFTVDSLVPLSLFFPSSSSEAAFLWSNAVVKELLSA